jgi:hypothetical protein
MLLRHAISMTLAACSIRADSALPVSITFSGDNRYIKVINLSERPISLYYNYVKSFGELQMFYVRFRDRNGGILPVDGTRDGWFTPKLYHSSLRFPPRKKLLLRPDQPVVFSRNIQHFVDWLRWDAPPDIAPCQIQIKLFGFKNNDVSQPVEAVSEWQAGPCPAPAPAA